MKSSLRQRIDSIKKNRCKHLIAVIEDPKDLRNIGTIIRNVNALGVEKVYVVDSKKILPESWEKMRNNRELLTTSVSAAKWTYVKKFNSTEDCIKHLQSKNYHSVVTSPHQKGKENFVLHEADYTSFPKLAVWFGNESRGISDTAIKHSKFCINMPMVGIIESLNLGTASGIVLYEVTKQRREYSKKYRHKNKHGKILA